jgi:hypothetical protein
MPKYVAAVSKKEFVYEFGVVAEFLWLPTVA